MHEQNLFALPVIYGKTEHFDKHETLDRLILLYNEYSRKNGALNRNIFVQQVQKIIPDLKVPETVVDSET